MIFKTIILSLLVSMAVAIAEDGQITKVVGDNSAYLVRNNQQILLKEALPLEQGDSIYSMDSVVLIYLRPTTQISISKNTHIIITKNLIEVDLDKEKSTSVIEFLKGLIRLQVTSDDGLEINQQIIADGVSFGVRGTEFEVSKEGEDFDLDVIEGKVEVTSPYVQTFVPEIVKANEGFKFNKKERRFQRRQFKTNFSGHPRFANKEEIRQRWKQKRKAIKEKRIDKKKNRKDDIKRRQKRRSKR